MFSYRRDAQVTFVANNFKNQQHIQIIRKRFVVYQALPSLHGGSFEKMSTASQQIQVMKMKDSYIKLIGGCGFFISAANNTNVQKIHSAPKNYHLRLSPSSSTFLFSPPFCVPFSADIFRVLANSEIKNCR